MGARQSLHQGEASTANTSAATELRGRAQDRFMLARRESVRVCSVFDGHSPQGQAGGAEEAEHAAAHFEKLLRSAPVWAALMEARKRATEPSDGVTHRLTEAVTAFFVDYQRQLEKRYDSGVRQPLLAEQSRLEAEINDTVQLDLPQEGGTTATIVIYSPESLVCAWVGDSEAVLARASTKDGEVPIVPTAVPLTPRKHQPSDAAENARATGRGGSVIGGVLFVKGAQGGLRVTRSLGDCALHANDIITAEPDVVTLARTPEDAFVIIGSDGLWDGVSFERAVELATAALRGCGKAGLKGALVAARQSLLAEAVTRQSHPDDVVAIVTVLNAEHALFRRLKGAS